MMDAMGGGRKGVAMRRPCRQSTISNKIKYDLGAKIFDLKQNIKRDARARAHAVPLFCHGIFLFWPTNRILIPLPK